MRQDIFDMLDRAGFGSNVREVAAEGECRVLRLDDETGEGFMTMYRVLDGVYLMYNDFHLKECVSEYQNADTLLCLDHCREGRIEHENENGGRYYMETGDIRIDSRVHHEGRIHMPLSHYHGITIGFVRNEAERAVSAAFQGLSFDLPALSERFCPNGKETLLRSYEPLNRVFSQLYQVPERIRIDYYRIKIAEILLLLGAADVSHFTEQKQYFPAKLTEKIEVIHDMITGSLSETYTVEALSARFDLPSATLRKVFRGVYGVPIYQYIKSYKMKAAASMLISDKDSSIAEIAQKTGYDNASKFSAAFKDIMGVTPLNYRNGQEGT
ncbi:MAG: AraC family transcriptional regulator [Oscillospiraceae bacterium]|nr:AraC family transcriptional regulator [Oscillospiraceae bacterium]